MYAVDRMLIMDSACREGKECRGEVICHVRHCEKKFHPKP
jgi:hypothetical protein